MIWLTLMLAKSTSQVFCFVVIPTKDVCHLTKYTVNTHASKVYITSFLLRCNSNEGCMPSNNDMVKTHASKVYITNQLLCWNSNEGCMSCNKDMVNTHTSKVYITNLLLRWNSNEG